MSEKAELLSRGHTKLTLAGATPSGSVGDTNGAIYSNLPRWSPIGLWARLPEPKSA